MIWGRLPIYKLPTIFTGRVSVQEKMVLSISFFSYVVFPFGALSALSNLTGQSISSLHREIGCCWDRDCRGLNEVVRNSMGFHVCVCMRWLYVSTISVRCVISMAWVHRNIKVKCVENVCKLHIRACFPYLLIRVFLGHTNIRLTLIGWVWTSYWRVLKWEWRGRV